jgi:hypothetical protein
VHFVDRVFQSIQAATGDSAASLQQELTLDLGREGELVASNDRIALRGADHLSAERKSDLLRGPGEGLLAHCRGQLVLHGSCVSRAHTAISLVGPSGIGKSSLSVALCKRGAALLSDGMTIVDPRTLIVTQRRPWWRLADDALRAFGLAPEEHTFDDALGQKRRLIGEEFAGASAPRLAHVLLVETGADISIGHLSGAEQILGLIRNAYLASVLPPSESPILLQRCDEAIARGVAVHRFLRPMDWARLDEVAAVIENLCWPSRPPRGGNG